MGFVNGLRSTIRSWKGQVIQPASAHRDTEDGPPWSAPRSWASSSHDSVRGAAAVVASRH